MSEEEAENPAKNRNSGSWGLTAPTETSIVGTSYDAALERRKTQAAQERAMMDRALALQKTESFQQKLIVDISHFSLSEVPFSPKFVSPETIQFNAFENELKKLPDIHKCYPNLTYIDIGDNKFKEIPSTVLKLTKLVTLRCYQNEITKVPSKILKLTNLEQLNFFDNKIEKIRKLIALTKLQELNISSNPLSAFPDVTNLKSLRRVAAFMCEIKERPDFSTLDSLESLNLSNNRMLEVPLFNPATQGNVIQGLNFGGNAISEIPLYIFQLQRLEQLDLTRNKLTVIPPEIAELKYLTALRLSVNSIKAIPPELYQLKSLKELDLADNQISCVDSDIQNLKKLQNVMLQRNKLTKLPKEFLKLKHLVRVKLIRNPLVTDDAETNDVIAFMMAKLKSDFDLSVTHKASSAVYGDEEIHPLSVRMVQGLKDQVQEPDIVSQESMLEDGDNLTRKRHHLYEAFVCNVPILQGLTKKERLKISNKLTSKEFATNDVILRQGDKGSTFYILYKGVVKFMKTLPDGPEELCVGEAIEGAYFGELALLGAQERQVSVIAKTSVVVLELNKKSFEKSMGPLTDILRRNTVQYQKYQSHFPSHTEPPKT